MFKKISVPILGLVLLMSASCSGSSVEKQEELAELVGNVFGLQSMAFMMVLYGMPVENVDLVMNETQTEATLTYTDYMVADALAAMGAPAEEAENLPFAGMSGTVMVLEDGSMNFDLTLFDSSVETLAFTFDNSAQTVVDLVADGEDYDISETLERMAEEQMQEQEAAAAAVEEEVSVEGEVSVEASQE
ncbi:MAG: hypothetical protein PQJ60_03815 [Spirochaetales bacterium]|nr:hypothetical protein [Spirochaetales bacterium]